MVCNQTKTTQDLCSFRNQFAPDLVRPLACSSRFLLHILLCIYASRRTSIQLPLGLSVRPNLRSSFCPSEAISPQLYQTLYMNSLGYCADVHSPIFQFEAFPWKKGVSCKIPIFTNISFSFSQNFVKLHRSSYTGCPKFFFLSMRCFFFFFSF